MTGPKSATDILGLEYDWLAVDARGRVGFFSTAGGGYAPPAMLADTDAQEAAIESILARPACTPVLFAPSLRADLKNTWLLVAERGLYAYDSSPNGGPYALIAAPEYPITVDQLDARVARVAKRVTLRIQFAIARLGDAELA
jgi:hypothetical protein